MTLPAETTSLQLPLPTLQMLPEGAGYHVRKGRLTLSATRRGDSLELDATADSAQVLISQERQHSTRHKTHSTVSQRQTDTAAGLATSLTYPISLLIIILVTLLWIKMYRPQKRS